MPHQVDLYVGKQIRQRRWMQGLTQQQLAEAVGIKFQQVQKYETGANRVSASRLWDIAQVLKVPVAYFFEGYVMGPQIVTTATGGPTDDREALQLLRSYYAMPVTQRRQIFELARVLSNAVA